MYCSLCHSPHDTFTKWRGDEPDRVVDGLCDPCADVERMDHYPKEF